MKVRQLWDDRQLSSGTAQLEVMASAQGLIPRSSGSWTSSRAMPGFPRHQGAGSAAGNESLEYGRRADSAGHGVRWTIDLEPYPAARTPPREFVFPGGCKGLRSRWSISVTMTPTWRPVPARRSRYERSYCPADRPLDRRRPGGADVLWRSIPWDRGLRASPPSPEDRRAKYDRPDPRLPFQPRRLAQADPGRWSGLALRRRAGFARASDRRPGAVLLSSLGLRCSLVDFVGGVDRRLPGGRQRPPTAGPSR